MRVRSLFNKIYRFLAPGSAALGSDHGGDMDRALNRAHAQAGDYRGTTSVRVVDGDTLELADWDITVRLARVDTPEEGEPGGRAATEAVQRKLDRATTLNVQVQSGGKYGRAVAEVEVDGQNLSDWLLREGYARRY